MGAILDMFPIIGRGEQGEYYSIGYTGVSAASSNHHGKILAKSIISQKVTD